ncbi:MAG: thiopurine S-methyltransferase [Gammaproteobacteria bacterium]
MEEDFWHRRWAKNEIGFHQQQINLHLKELWPLLEVESESPVFVPLCGKSRDMLWLAGQGHPVLGIEISEIAVRDFFREAALTPVIEESPPFTRYRSGKIELLRGDFFALTAERLESVPAVYDRASLIAFPPDMRQRYVAHLKEVLAPATRTLLVTLEYDQAQMTGPPFSVTESEVLALYADFMQIERLRSLDVLEENPRFIQRGLTALTEKVFKLVRK